MGKSKKTKNLKPREVTWDDLRLIYEGQYGVTAVEASEWIGKELFSKNWFGTADTIGRMWEDIENCIVFSEFLQAVDKFMEETKYTNPTVAYEVMHEEKHTAVRDFGKLVRTNFLKEMGSKRFRNLCGQWKIQLTNAGFLKPKPMSEFAKRRLEEAQKRLDKKLVKEKLLIKRSSKK
tara:strand:+ start:60 stop:590 length:531 start_codon:yes stop_codon:yes gene_type:complete